MVENEETGKEVELRSKLVEKAVNLVETDDVVARFVKGVVGVALVVKPVDTLMVEAAELPGSMDAAGLVGNKVKYRSTGIGAGGCC